jgi:hypothetical protein
MVKDYPLNGLRTEKVLQKVGRGGREKGREIDGSAGVEAAITVPVPTN